MGMSIMLQESDHELYSNILDMCKKSTKLSGFILRGPSREFFRNLSITTSDQHSQHGYKVIFPL